MSDPSESSFNVDAVGLDDLSRFRFTGDDDDDGYAISSLCSARRCLVKASSLPKLKDKYEYTMSFPFQYVFLPLVASIMWTFIWLFSSVYT